MKTITKIEVRSFVKVMTHLAGMNTGWGNGYCVIPKGHKLHGKDYDSIHNEIDLEIHGGLTFACAVKDLDWDELTKEDKNGWVVGFDCAHLNDTHETCPKSYVEKEANNLKEQLA